MRDHMDRRVTLTWGLSPPRKQALKPSKTVKGHILRLRELISASYHFCLPTTCNGPFYQYGGHIELIQFKEYYRMPSGHEHISVVFLSTFRDIFLKVFLE